MSLAHSMAVGVAFLGATVASQLPEFAQQYRQRLGGALDELNAIVTQFHDDAARAGMDEGKAVAALKTNADQVARDRGQAMADTIARRGRLAAQSAAFESAGAFGRLAALAGNVDPQIAGRAWRDFEPAMPVTTEGFAAAGGGAIAGYAAARLLAAPFRRRRRKPAA